MSALLILLAEAVGILFTIAGVLVLMARWLKFPRRGFGRSLLIAFSWLVLAVISFAITLSLGDSRLAESLSLLVFVGTCILEVLSIRWLLGASFGKALAGWGTTLVARGFWLVVALVFLRGMLVEAYQEPTMSMAPTLLSRHGVQVCPKCGGTMVFDMDNSVLERLARDRRYSAKPLPLEGFCLSCGQAAQALPESLSAVAGDRFMTAKYLKPRRWDLLTFRHKESVFIKRVVGMPGEEISIDDAGHITIDGKPMTPPPDAPATFPWLILPQGMSPDRVQFFLRSGEKAKLGADDYFVIGDHATASNDSRIFGSVHSDEIVGVATLIYWPPTRARILR